MCYDTHVLVQTTITPTLDVEPTKMARRTVVTNTRSAAFITRTLLLR
jgi:hypothetical protein